MIFELKEKKDKILEETYKQSMKELDKFFEINWNTERPKVFILKDRKMIDSMKDYKTQRWIVAFEQGKNVFLLDKKNYNKESSHKYNLKDYKEILKHELTHAYTNALFSGDEMIFWLFEGCSMYLGNKDKYTYPPVNFKFKNFLKYYNKTDSGVYLESGYTVGLLIKHFGKEKILKLFKKSKYVRSKKEFYSVFEKIYGFKLNYTNFNKLLKPKTF